MTIKDVATWMLEQVRQQKTLTQAAAVDGIRLHFGEQFIYTTEATERQRGSVCIDKQVLKAFRELSGGEIVRVRGYGGYWRLRDERDDPNKRQA